MNDLRIFHTINRLTFGSTAGLIQQVKKMGIEAYIQAQLKPTSIAIPDSLTQKNSTSRYFVFNARSDF